MKKYRMLPPPEVAYQVITFNGRTYSAAPGTTVDVIEPDAGVLGANGWTIIAPVGSTAERPTGRAPEGGFAGDRGRRQMFIDTDLSAVIAWDGEAWRNVISGAAV